MIDMRPGESLALVVRPGNETQPSSLGALLRGAADEVLEFPTPADALDGLRVRADHKLPVRRVLFVIDQRGGREVHWTWVSMLVHMALGPVILIVDDARAGIAEAARTTGVSACLEERHLTRHPSLLVQAARRALEPRRQRAPATVEA